MSRAARHVDHIANLKGGTPVLAWSCWLGRMSPSKTRMAAAVQAGDLVTP
jgi:hypothetical protein